MKRFHPSRLGAILWACFVWPSSWKHWGSWVYFRIGVTVIVGGAAWWVFPVLWLVGALLPVGWAALGFGPRDLSDSTPVCGWCHPPAHPDDVIELRPWRLLTVATAVGMLAHVPIHHNPWLVALRLVAICFEMWTTEGAAGMLLEWWPRQGPPRKRRRIRIKLPDVSLVGKGGIRPVLPQGAPS